MKKLLLALIAATALAAQAQNTDAEVKKVDKAQGKITLAHSGIKTLDVPPMTMALRVKDARMLEGVNAGDKVKATIEKVDGQYTVTSLSKAQ